MIPKAPKHRRAKPKAKAAPTKEEARHMDRIAQMGCVVCGAPASLHHVMAVEGKKRRRDHRFVVSLCWHHHQGPNGVHGLGSEERFREVYGIDLVTWAKRQWAESQARDEWAELTEGLRG